MGSRLIFCSGHLRCSLETPRCPAPLSHPQHRWAPRAIKSVLTPRREIFLADACFLSNHRQTSILCRAPRPPGSVPPPRRGPAGHGSFRSWGAAPPGRAARPRRPPVTAHFLAGAMAGGRAALSLPQPIASSVRIGGSRGVRRGRARGRCGGRRGAAETVAGTAAAEGGRGGRAARKRPGAGRPRGRAALAGPAA